ncbi:glycine betaine ABC transporter substrate-binding protein [Pectinatus sottacetonis]|uniref:glycine betaine ABC transporter substrate-binding protein n=1 Tax=Pectinatus sottacetonis TaxID=1002795 RepID=UPI0018C7FE14|nr:glycine betaine ABC transporter substrate-binding protein [Pectinatus sottacetonis]
MFTTRLKKIIMIGLSIGTMALLLTGCGNNSQSSSEQKKEVKLSYVEWDTEVASTNVIAQVLRDLGYKVEITPLDNAVMWQAVASGKSDGMVAAWLPSTHSAQYKKYGKDMVNLGPNLEGAKIGLVVPDYVKADSIADLKNEADKTITGIEPGAGVCMKTEKALKEYPNLKGWKLETSSSGAMVTALGKAIKDKKAIIVTGWSPHWMFATYKLKYLKDPKNVFGGEEHINTMVRKGLKKDMPDVYKVLDNFHWTVDDINSVMLDISKGMKPEDAARKWIKGHPDKVAEWTKGIAKK